MFEFKHIKPFDKQFIDNPGAMVVFATPGTHTTYITLYQLKNSETLICLLGMLHAGLSLQIFKKWAPNENNMVHEYIYRAKILH